MIDKKAVKRYHYRVKERLAKRGLRFDAREWEEDKHPRGENGRFVSSSGSGHDIPNRNSIGELPSAKEIGFKPRTKSEYRNRRDEIVARHKALREKNGEDGLPDCTVDPDTGEMVNFEDGFQVSFQTSVSEQDGDGALSDGEYDRIAGELSKRTGSRAYIGVFDEPETSFHCKNYSQAMNIAKKYNQHSILNWKMLNKYKDEEWTDEVMSKIFPRNPFYDPSKNHVKGE